MDALKIPTRKESLDVFQRYVLFSNVEEHCVTTATVAMYLTEKIKAKRLPDLNLDIVFATSLFHDLAKGAVIGKLEPERFGFKPFTKQQMQAWKLLRGLNSPLQSLFDDLKAIKSGFEKKVHETDVASIIIGALYPDFLAYMHQIGGTRNTIYYNAIPEIKIMHYADWIIHKTDLVPFEARLDFLFYKYWNDPPEKQRSERKKKEFELESGVFEGLDISPAAIDLAELNKLKSKLFGGKYDYFKIGRVEKIDFRANA